MKKGTTNSYNELRKQAKSLGITLKNPTRVELEEAIKAATIQVTPKAPKAKKPIATITIEGVIALGEMVKFRYPKGKYTLTVEDTTEDAKGRVLVKCEELGRSWRESKNYSVVLA